VPLELGDKIMNYRITENQGVYTATIPIPLESGKILLINGRASLEDTYKDFGINPEVGGFFGDVGRFFKKITKSKALRKAVGVAKSILKSPVTTAALGVVTGGAAIPALASANAAIRIAEEAKKTGKKAANARKLMRATMKVAEKKKLKRIAIAQQKNLVLKHGKLPIEKLGSKIKAKKAALSRQPVTSRAADFLVNVHFA
jgi:hypothetical protein